MGKRVAPRYAVGQRVCFKRFEDAREIGLGNAVITSIPLTYGGFLYLADFEGWPNGFHVSEDEIVGTLPADQSVDAVCEWLDQEAV